MSTQKKAPVKGKKKKSKLRKLFWLVLLLVLASAAWLVLYPILKTPFGKTAILYVKTGESFKQASNRWMADGEVSKWSVFPFISGVERLDRRVRSGAYTFPSTTGQFAMLMKLLKGQEDEIKLTLSGILSYDEIIGRIGEKLEPDSAEIASLMNDRKFLDSLGLTKNTRLSMFIPDSYQFYWDTDAKKVIGKLHKYYLDFWTYERRKKAEKQNLTIQQVSALASIVDGEAIHFDEMPAIAGLYLNRYHQKMALQADPTVKFALGLKAVRRLTYEDYKIDHPYNTYRISGLPPGPISMASKQAIEAVLNPESHEYLFMVAKADRSGYHHFTKTFEEHKAYSKQYTRSLDQRGVGR